MNIKRRGALDEAAFWLGFFMTAPEDSANFFKDVEKSNQGVFTVLRDLSIPAFSMGILAAFGEYSASFAIVLAGLTTMGATGEQATTGLYFATLGMGICSIWLPAVTRIPAAVAWSTPGAAFLAAMATLPGGFGEAVGALIFCAGLIVLTGFIPTLGRIVAAIPKPITNGLLAGVLLKLCLAPAIALGTIPLLVLPVLVAWLIGLTWNRLAAMPSAVLAFLVVLIFAVDTSGKFFKRTHWS